jgi:hypothetical protein
MPQRNGQNPIHAVKNFEHKANNVNATAKTPAASKGSAFLCPSCKTEVPPKPGFRFSALKCPKCGASMGK